MELGGWMGSTILYLVLCAIQLTCVNSSVFRVENNIGKLVFWRGVSNSPKLTSLLEKKQFCVISDKNQLNLMRLVHAMHSNGPLPQVDFTESLYILTANTAKIKTSTEFKGDAWRSQSTYISPFLHQSH